MEKELAGGVDAHLLEGIRNQDPAVLRKIYADLFPGIEYFVLSSKGSEEDAHDLFQEAMIILFKKCQQPTFQLSCKLKTYVQAVCRRMWLNKKSRSKDIHVSGITEKEENEIVGADFGEAYEREEREQLYREYFQKLGEGCRSILSLFLSGVRLKEIAEKLGISGEGAAKKKKYKCQKRLIEWIKNDARYKELRLG